MKENELYSIKKTKDLSRFFKVEYKKVKKIMKSEKLNLDNHADLVNLIIKIET